MLYLSYLCKQLFAGDEHLNKVEELFYPIIKIIRIESGGNFEYEINSDLVIVSGGKEELRIPVKTFIEQSSKLLAKLELQRVHSAFQKLKLLWHL
jgi:type II restriction enzyme